jgi:hypothetical protein
MISIEPQAQMLPAELRMFAAVARVFMSKPDGAPDHPRFPSGRTGLR